MKSDTSVSNQTSVSLLHSVMSLPAYSGIHLWLRRAGSYARWTILHPSGRFSYCPLLHASFDIATLLVCSLLNSFCGFWLLLLFSCHSASGQLPLSPFVSVFKTVWISLCHAGPGFVAITRFLVTVFWRYSEIVLFSLLLLCVSVLSSLLGFQITEDRDFLWVFQCMLDTKFLSK